MSGQVGAGAAKPAERMDPTLLAVLAHRFEAIVREMTNTLFRTGRSSILNMARDFSCSIITADDQLFAAAEGLQVHVLGAGLQTASMRKLHPDLREGDAFLHNDPMLGNTHAADHTILVPVFVDGEHVFTTSAKAHQADCGNSEPSTYMAYAEDVYAEGALIFPCAKVQRDYTDVEDVIRLCRRRIRVPEVWYGDYLAAIGAARIGERRVKEAVERYGIETIKAFVGEWLDYSERCMEQAIRKLPARRLEQSSRHDPIPGLPEGVEVKVTAEVDPERGRVSFDLRDNPDCIPFGLNLSEACARGGCTIALLNCLEEDIPRNAGAFRRIEVKIREGSIAGGLVEPYSASVSTTNVLNRLINAAQSSFCELGEGQGLAEGAGALGVGFAVFSGELRGRRSLRQPDGDRQQRRPGLALTATAGSPTRCPTARRRSTSTASRCSSATTRSGSAPCACSPTPAAPAAPGAAPPRRWSTGRRRRRCAPSTSPTSPSTRPRACSAVCPA